MKGKYAHSEYREYEAEIIEMIKSIYKDRELPKYSTYNLKRAVALKIRADITDDNFQVAFKNAMKKLDMVPIPE